MRAPEKATTSISSCLIPKKLENQYVFVSARENARTAQYYALLMTIRAALMSDDGYNVERVTRAVVAAFDELEGRLSC